jgi:hypothetical protein
MGKIDIVPRLTLQAKSRATDGARTRYDSNPEFAILASIRGKMKGYSYTALMRILALL